MILFARLFDLSFSKILTEKDAFCLKTVTYPTKPPQLPIPGKDPLDTWPGFQGPFSRISRAAGGKLDNPSLLEPVDRATTGGTVGN